MPRRLVMWLPNRVGALACMPAYMQNTGLIGLKAISAFPGNHGTEYDPHQGVVMLFDGACGFPIAIVDAREITAVRTAAASAVATRLLARKDASDLVLLGSGVQARKHLEAMRAVRPISRVRVWNPFPGLARKFAESEQVNQGIAIEALEGKRADVTGADIICTVTSSTEPVLFGSDIPEGVHINAVGSSFPHARELDSEVIIRANLFVDLRESTLNEAGDVCSVSTKRRFDR
jgi:ornithine cyclodeaminase/alanine dehydrogenase-like protein (mu-crystallin family)